MTQTLGAHFEDLTRAATYLRASTELQKYSTSNQAAALGRYAIEHGYAVVRVYEDDGRSGLDLNGRPGLQQLLKDALALRDLERDGLITRHVFPTKPPSVEYRLAPLGHSLLEPMANLVDWADCRYADIHAARAGFDGSPGDAPR